MTDRALAHTLGHLLKSHVNVAKGVEDEVCDGWVGAGHAGLPPASLASDKPYIWRTSEGQHSKESLSSAFALSRSWSISARHPVIYDPASTGETSHRTCCNTGSKIGKFPFAHSPVSVFTSGWQISSPDPGGCGPLGGGGNGGGLGSFESTKSGDGDPPLGGQNKHGLSQNTRHLDSQFAVHVGPGGRVWCR